MARPKPQADQQIQLIDEIERNYPQAQSNPDARLMYLFECLITHSPENALQLLTRHRKNGIQSLRNIQGSIATLADQLLGRQQLSLVEDLMQLATEWHVSIDSKICQKLAKAYRQKGDFPKAREILYSIIKKDRTNAATILGDLYEMARTEGQDSEAHSLLGQLVLADPSPATTIFAYKERSDLAPAEGPPVRIALLSSYTLDPLVPYLDFECRLAGLVPEFYIAPFNQYMQEILQASSGLYRFKPEIVFVAVAIEDLYPAVGGYPSTQELDKARVEIRERIHAVVDALSERCDAL